MPSLADSAVIFILALMLFGPKKLPQLARQLGKLMAEFRRASNEFRMQMEDELRVEEQKEHEAKVAAMAGPPSSAPATLGDGNGTPIPGDEYTLPPHPHDEPPMPAEPTPIAEAGDLKMMPPSTGMPTPIARKSFGAGDPYATNPQGATANGTGENSILPPAGNVGVSSDEPLEESRIDPASTPSQEQTHA
jgi:sec-independent protein translocase protein TatB